MANQVTQTEAEVMAKAASDTEDVSAQLASAMNTLLNDLAPLATEWVGQGGSAFQTLMDGLSREYTRLYGSLEWIGGATRSGGTDLTVTDDELRRAMEQAGAPIVEGHITSALGGLQ